MHSRWVPEIPCVALIDDCYIEALRRVLKFRRPPNLALKLGSPSCMQLGSPVGSDAGSSRKIDSKDCEDVELLGIGIS